MCVHLCMVFSPGFLYHHVMVVCCSNRHFLNLNIQSYRILCDHQSVDAIDIVDRSSENVRFSFVFSSISITNFFRQKECHEIFQWMGRFESINSTISHIRNQQHSTKQIMKQTVARPLVRRLYVHSNYWFSMLKGQWNDLKASVLLLNVRGKGAT